ncbi:hypothetical protein BDW59DRAFT_145130 [Aspergillus cavernicola]|uniref:Uncharacterized protein n=1 Tax=Aspergillus cavernicola TaxID=176166 RepID=A0ABR4IF87_9EURO
MVPKGRDVAQISAASCQCATEMCSEGLWVIEVARQLLQIAIAGLPLECWSVSDLAVSPTITITYQ